MVDKAFTPRAILEFCGFIRKAGFSGGEATEKGPEISEPSLTLTMLSFAAAVAATAATQEFPEPTHDQSPLATAHREQSGRLCLRKFVKIGRASCRERVCQYV